MSFVTLYKAMVEDMNEQSNHIEIFQQSNYKWLQNVVDMLKLKEVKVSRKSLCPVPEISPEPMIADISEEMCDDSCEIIGNEESAFSTISQFEGETVASLMSMDSDESSEFQTERSSLFDQADSTLYSSESEGVQRSVDFLEDEEEEEPVETAKFAEEETEEEPVPNVQICDEEEDFRDEKALTVQESDEISNVETSIRPEEVKEEFESKILTVNETESESGNGIVFVDAELLDDSDSDSEIIPTKSGVRFVDSSDLRLSIDPSSLQFLRNSAKPTLSEQLSELSASAAQFRMKWHDMVKEKNQQVQEIVPAPAEAANEPYVMSDCSDSDDASDYGYSESEDDEEIYDENATEIHGKKIPSWAQKGALEIQLEKQKSIDPDSIFPELSLTCQLGDVFNSNNPSWNKRNESCVWDQDGVTPEEVLHFKQMLGFV